MNGGDTILCPCNLPLASVGNGTFTQRFGALLNQINKSLSNILSIQESSTHKDPALLQHPIQAPTAVYSLPAVPHLTFFL